MKNLDRRRLRGSRSRRATSPRGFVIAGCLCAVAISGCGTAPSDSAPGAPKPAAARPTTTGGPHGDVRRVVPKRAVATQSPAGLGATPRASSGISVTIRSSAPITARAQAPGEVSGAGVRITIALVNRGQSALNLNAVTVDLRGSDGAPATPLSTAPAKPFAGTLAAGRAATGVYVFVLPQSQRRAATVVVSRPTGDAVSFKGDVG